MIFYIYVTHRNYLDCISGFITTKEDVAHLVTTLRASYQSWISENRPSILKSLSIEGTVAGAIQEVCAARSVVMSI